MDEWPEYIEEEDEFPELLLSDEEIDEMVRPMFEAGRKAAAGLQDLARAMGQIADCFGRMRDDHILGSDVVE